MALFYYIHRTNDKPGTRVSCSSITSYRTLAEVMQALRRAGSLGRFRHIPTRCVYKLLPKETWKNTTSQTWPLAWPKE